MLVNGTFFLRLARVLAAIVLVWLFYGSMPVKCGTGLRCEMSYDQDRVVVKVRSASEKGLTLTIRDDARADSFMLLANSINVCDQERVQVTSREMVYEPRKPTRLNIGVCDKFFFFVPMDRFGSGTVVALVPDGVSPEFARLDWFAPLAGSVINPGLAESASDAMMSWAQASIAYARLLSFSLFSVERMGVMADGALKVRERVVTKAADGFEVRDTIGLELIAILASAFAILTVLFFGGRFNERGLRPNIHHLMPLGLVILTLLVFEPWAVATAFIGIDLLRRTFPGIFLLAAPLVVAFLGGAGYVTLIYLCLLVVSWWGNPADLECKVRREGWRDIDRAL